MKKLTYILILLLFAAGCTTTNNLHNLWKPTQLTPYDEKYEKILKYLEKSQEFSYISDQKHFGKEDYWQNPDEIEISKAGDCEDKSLWLYSKLIEEGYTDIRLVIGKYKAGDTDNHVWIEWYDNDDIFILDGTSDDGLQILSHLPEWLYKPLYSYYKDQKWEHVEWKVVEAINGVLNEVLINSNKTENIKLSLVVHPNRNFDLNLPFSDQMQLKLESTGITSYDLTQSF